MAYRINPLLDGVIDPPMAEVASWAPSGPRAGEQPILDLSQAQPSYPPAEALQAQLAKLIQEPATSRYTAIAGLPGLRSLLSQRMNELYDARTVADDCFITAGCNHAFCAALQAIARQGDEVLLALPYYFNHQMWLEMCGIRDVHLPFRSDRGGEPDPQDAADRISPRTRAMVLVTPNNPTGAVYRPETIHAFYELAQEHGLALILDETYRDFIDPEHSPHELFAEPGWRETVVHLYSFSKSYSLAGYRVGALVSGPRLLEAVARIMDTTTICAPAIGQHAALFGLEHLNDWLDDKRQLLEQRRSSFEAAVGNDQTGFRVASLGPYFAYLEHPFAQRSASKVAKELATSQQLLTVPGSVFGPGQERFLRLAFANVPEYAATEVARRLAALATATGEVG